MTTENTQIQKELDELNEEYNALVEEVREEATNPDVSNAQMHIFNMVIAAVMIIIGILFAYQSRNSKTKSGKKIAGWILLVLGILTLIAHTVQLFF